MGGCASQAADNETQPVLPARLPRLKLGTVEVDQRELRSDEDSRAQGQHEPDAEPHPLGTHLTLILPRTRFAAAGVTVRGSVVAKANREASSTKIWA